jgi:hypothetical protein
LVISKHDKGMIYDRSGDSHPLLLTTGELIGVMVSALQNTHRFESGIDLFFSLMRIKTGTVE